MSSMKKVFSLLLIGAAMGVGVVTTAASAIAQTSDIDPVPSTGTDDDGASDLLGDLTSPFELIHRAILAPSMSAEEYQLQQQRVIQGEAQNFRLLQQELLRQQNTLEATDEISIDGEAL
jgi:hypothetical protein